MIHRLGNVLYWTGASIAILIMALVGYSVALGPSVDHIGQGMAVLAAAVIWLIGLACRYVLTGNAVKRTTAITPPSED